MPDDLETRVAVLESKVDGLVTTVLTRLLDTALPARAEPPANDAPGPTDADPDDRYAEPAAVADWTDPFMGLDDTRDYRAVGRLEAGELPPYLRASTGELTGNGTADATAVDRWRAIGEGAFDEWNRATHQPDVEVPGARGMAGGWVAPIDLGDEVVE